MSRQRTPAACTDMASSREQVRHETHERGQEGAGFILASAEPKWRVLIAHPGRQYSHQAALALHEAGYLACYATGIPVSNRQFGRAGQWLLGKYSVYDDVAVPLQLTRLNMVAPIVNRLLARHLPEYVVGPLQYETYRIFDRWIAKLIARQHVDAVIAYENSALHTFEAAKEIGAACILDAASLHRVEADQRYQVGLPPAYKRRIDLRKDMEVDLADCIFTTSDLAAQSYLTHIRSSIMVKPIHLGVDVDIFKPAAHNIALNSSGEPFSFVFVGTATRRKGFDLLIDSVERLLEEGLPFRIVVAGVMDESLFVGKKRVLQTIRHCGMIGHNELAAVLRNAHCLVLPSRFDSFGMVVPEAMACGLPVIVSDMVGAKQLVEDGRSGFVVPAGSLNALMDKMRWFIHNRELFNQMSFAARAAAEEASWAKYRRRFAVAVREVLVER
jgi:glycosyltransferase involved in cell wall biosynthesis